MKTVRERLFSRLIIDPDSGCLLWTGRISDGYGRIEVNGQRQPVHRVMWEMFEGPVPDGLQLDHLCRVRRCANVSHLEPVTARENTLRGESVAALNAVKTHCPAGHAYDLLNTYFLPGGRRQCRACNRDAVRRYRARKNGLQS